MKLTQYQKEQIIESAMAKLGDIEYEAHEIRRNIDDKQNCTAYKYFA